MNKIAELRIGIVPSLLNAGQEEAINCFEQLPTAPCARPGFEVEIIDIVMTLLKWNYTWVIADELGSASNGSGTGLIGMVHRDEVDIGASTMRFLAERMELVDFAFPIWYYRQVFTIAKPQALSFRHFAFTAFDPIVWVLFALCLLLCVLVDWKINCLLLLHDRTTKQKVYAGVVSLQNYIAIILGQDVHLPRFASITTLISFYAFFCLFLTNYYKSVMTGMLAVPLSPRIPFRSIDKLIEQLETKERFLVYFFDGYEPSYHDSLKERFKNSLITNPIRVSEIMSVVVDNIAQHGGVYFGSEYDDKIPFQVSDSDPNNNFITIRDDTIAPAFGSFMFPKNSSYLKQFNSALISILPGVNRIKGSYWQQKAYRPAEYSASVGTTILTMDHLWEIFSIWLFGLFLAIACCLLELYGWRRANKRLKVQYEQNAVGMIFSQINRLQIAGVRRRSRMVNYLPTIFMSTAPS